MDKLCKFCFNAYSDTDGKLTPENDLSYCGIGDTEKHYSMYMKTKNRRY